MRDAGLIAGSGRSPGEGQGNPFPYSCLENPTDRSLAGYGPWGCKESDTTEATQHAYILAGLTVLVTDCDLFPVPIVVLMRKKRLLKIFFLGLP